MSIRQNARQALLRNERCSFPDTPEHQDLFCFSETRNVSELSNFKLLVSQKVPIMLKATIDKKANTLTIVIEMQKPTLSASGKTKVVASTHGNVVLADCQYDGKPLTVGLNAYFKP